MGATDLSVLPQRSIVFPETVFRGLAPADVPLRVEGIVSQSGNLTEWRNSDGLVRARIGPGGAIWTDQDLVTTSNGSTQLGGANWYGATLNVTARASDNKGIVVRGLTGQTGHLQEWQNAAAASLGWMAKDGASYAQVGNFGAWLHDTGSGNNGASLTSTPLVASSLGLVVRGRASQTGDLTQWQNSAGSVLAYIDSSGNFSTQGARTTILGTTGRISSIQENHTLGTHSFFGGDPALGIQATAAGRLGLVVRGQAGQTANLAEFQLSSGTPLVSIDTVDSASEPSSRLVLNISILGQKRVVVGPPDSAGSGYRSLRVVN